MSDHTPEPWDVVESDPKALGRLRPFTVERAVTMRADGKRYHAVVVAEIMETGTAGEADANAHLIAAAPKTAAERDRLREVNAELVKALKWYRHETVIIGWQTAMVDGVLAKATEDRA